MKPLEFSVLGPLMGGFGSQAFLGCVHLQEGIRPAVMVFLPEEIPASPQLFERVWHETELGTQIDHINVIAVMGLAKLEEGYARVVEYADAESLRSVYRRALTLKKPIPPAVATAIIADACMGTHYAHELGAMETGKPLIHGAVRPETLLVSFQGMAKVTGYGATTIAEISRRAKPDVKDGYTAPEQAYGGRAAATAQTDVYSLGCVYYEALTGKVPFSPDNELAEALIHDELNKPGLQGVTPEMAAIVLKATRRKSSERFASALEMRQALLDQCTVASSDDIKRFMDELFPADAVPRATRNQMLAKATKEPPAPSGTLLTELPREVTAPTRAKGSVLSDIEIAAAAGTRPKDAGERLVQRVLDRAPSSAVAPPTPAIGIVAPTAEELTAAAMAATAAARARAASEAIPPPSWQAPVTIPPLPSAPPPPPPAVANKGSPLLWMSLGLAVGVAALALYLLFRGDREPPAPVVAVASAAPPAPPPPPPQAPTASASSAASAEAPSGQGAAGREPDREPVRANREPKPTETGPGTLKVTTTPSLEISVDGKVIGTGEASVQLPAGKHRVRGRSAALGIDVNEVATVKAGGTTTASLEASKGSLAIDAPPGCDVVIDGKGFGKTPGGPYELYVGTHKVVVRKGAINYTHTVPVRAGTESFLQVQFHDG